jgi:amino acid adenylation domain-containing protein
MANPMDLPGAATATAAGAEAGRRRPERCVHELFADRAARTPGAPAVLAGGASLTYAELDARSTRLARVLRGAGVGPEVAVALGVERTPELVVGILGIWKAGGVYVPLDPGYPRERLRFVVDDAGAAVLLTLAELEDRFPWRGGPVVLLDRLPEPDGAAEPERGARPGNLAYVIYTSGSTGTPKGVAVEHRSLAGTLLGTLRAFGIRAGDVVPALASHAFDISLFELFAPLLAGGAVRLVPRERVREAATLPDAMRDATVLHAVPALMGEIAGAARSRGGALPALRRVLVGGDAVAPGLVDRMREAFPAADAFVMYGPTEAAVICAAYPVPERGGVPGTLVGRPLPGVSFHVHGEDGEPVRAGTPGELWIGGAGVARGYAGRPDATAERFVPDPSAGEPGARLYRTGDRVRWLPEGMLEFLGRVDRQVKIRGFRIEPGEVEAVLLRSPAVRAAAVVAREDVPGHPRLVGYVVPEGAADASPAALRAYLAERLPEHMVPSALVVLDSLPLTPTGKVDRGALPAPEDAGGAEYAAPRTQTEEIVAGLSAGVLGLERVGVDDDFFALGGHSLSATRLATRVREALGVDLPLPAVFEAPTAAALAGRVDALLRGGAGEAVPPVVRVPRRGGERLPLSFAQQRLWFLWQMDPAGAGYNMPFPLRLRGRLDARALERALEELVRRHESLRTVFAPTPEGPAQEVRAPAPLPLPLADLGALPAAHRGREALRLAEEDAARPFDLRRGPVLRATLLRLSHDDAVLLLCMHHVVSDGWSTGVLFRELSALYDAFARGASSPLPEPEVQYADFAVWQRERLSGARLAALLAWWRERLDGAPRVLELPTDRPRPPAASGRGAVHGFRVPAAAAAPLRALARREGATLYMVALAAWQALLARWSGQEELVVGTPIANRTRRETEGLIGFFVNTLALRGSLAGDPSFRALVGRVRDATVGAYAHQDLPFERLVEEIAPERSLSHTPLFQVMFALQNTPGEEQALALAGITLGPLSGGLQTARFLGIRDALFDLELELVEDGAEVVGSLRYRTDLFDAATVERIAAHFGTLLDGAASDPDLALSRLPLLPAAERRRLAELGTGPAPPAGRADPVPDRIAAQAERTPGAVAVESGGESVTYARLEARAERLARALRASGAGPGARVGVCVERGPGVLAGMLAVWKAGGVYLPLDPGLPAERLAFMLRDSGTELVVADARSAAALPERGIRVVSPDADAEGGPDDARALSHSRTPALSHSRTPALSHSPSPGDPAYLIYTSGSTGTPKAVMVGHAQLAHTLAGAQAVLGFRPGDEVAALAPVAFDISLLEMLAPLCAGAAVRIVPRAQVVDVEALVEAVRGATVLHAVPALMRRVVEAARPAGGLPRLRMLLVGGDTVPPDLLDEVRGAFPAARVHVLYGPTEATIICATYAVPAEGRVEGHPLGTPLPGVRLRVCDARGAAAPLGVPGELWISGGGVSRGYLGLPELTADRFVAVDGEPAYRTGDRARWRADGVLEFLGRMDDQVKVRGFRVEPGEVEAAVRGQPGVREAVVVAREDAPGDRRLVAYVVPEVDGEWADGADGALEQVEGWESLFDDTYAAGEEDGAADPTLNLVGWNSSYTGEPIPREEMREWTERTVERILALRPRRVLEIGCGTGLLLFRVAPHVEAYHGTDFSAAALDHVRRHARGIPGVRLSRRPADRLDGLDGEGFDTVVLNSVAQYFPRVDYLLRVLEGAAAVLRPGGTIFVGDVRSLPLLPAFHSSVERFRAPGGLPAEQLRARVRRGVAEEQELAVAPAFWEALRARVPRIGRVEAQVKRAAHDNEVSRYRYDVVLRLDAPPLPEAPVFAWGAAGGLDGLRGRLASSPEALAVAGVPSARVAGDLRALDLLGRRGTAATAAELHRALEAEAPSGVDPEALWALGEADGRAVQVRPGADGGLDVLFGPAGGGGAGFPASPAEPAPWASYANDPQFGRRVRALVPALRASLGERLPEYMVPAAFVVLDSLPVTPNGKVDRAALPAPDPGRAAAAGEYVAPRTPAEARVAAVWSEVLGTERVGAHDDFFALGGHSLLATRVVSRVREALGVELPLRALFEAPTVAGLAARLEGAAPGGAAAGPPPVVRIPRDPLRPLPLSFGQQRLWFIEQLEPDAGRYNVVYPLRLRGRLEAAALRRALGEVARRHEVLRARFPAVGGEPVQVVDPPAPVPLPTVDFGGLPERAREAAMVRLADAETLRPFDLARGPLLRVSLLRLAADHHVLLLNLHHTVYDGWSTGVLHRELAALYGAFLRGAASPLPDLPVQYADFAAWQREHLSGAALERQLAYWTAALAGAPPTLELPLDRPRRAAPGARGLNRSLVLSGAAAAPLRALARAEGATLFMALLAGWQLLLSRYAGQEDVVVGSPVAGRTRPEIEPLIGFFVNTLAFRADLSGDPGFRGLLGRVRAATLGGYAHQEVPFERLVEELRVERSLTHTPLFQVMLAVHRHEPELAHLDGLRAEVVEVGVEPAIFDLLLNVYEREDDLLCVLTYRAELWEEATAARMLDHFGRLLADAASAPDRPCSEVEMIGPEERERVLHAWNATAADFPRAGVHRLFEEQARRTPGVPALAAGGESLTYAELDARAGRLARCLGRLGVGPDVRVGLLLERSAELVVALLGVLKAGGAYVPLDPAYPAERIAYILEDSRARLVVVQAATRELLPAVDGVQAMLLDAVEADSARVATPHPPAPSPTRGEGENDGLEVAGSVSHSRTFALPHSPSPDNLAYVIYTSGSTGRPKGVAMPHGPLASLVAWQARTGVEGPAATLQFASVSFDVSFQEMFTCWAAGGRLVVAPEEARREPAELLALLASEGIERLFLPYVALQGVAEEAVARGTALPRLREVRTAGEQLRITPAIRAWLGALGVPLHNDYGPSETHVATSHALRGSAAEWPVLPSIGRPVANARCLVLDGGLRPAPVGVPGELYLGGECLARGYLDRPALTAERFLPDPFAAESGARAYRTGDRARWRADGTLEFLGRADQQVKVRGFRIEPGEVEAVLERHPAVREAVVVARGEGAAGRLVAYVVPAEGVRVAADELRAHAGAALPEYMVPAAVVVLEELPLTPSGKTDRRALPAPDPAADAGAYVAPRTPAEEALAAVWAETLGVPRVSVHDGFFALGGHSLLAMRLVSRARAALGVEIPVRAVFEAQTVAELAARLGRAPGSAAPHAPPPIAPADRSGPLPLSFAQERLWFLHRLAPESVAYNVPASLRLRGPLDAGALRRALAALVERHESLRTVFPAAAGEPSQAVLPAGGFVLPVVDLGGLAEMQGEAEAGRGALAVAASPFRLERGPLFRAALLRLRPDDHVLALAMHHVVSDGWSMGVLFRDLEALYGALVRGEPSPLPAPALQYADYAVWQREWLRGEVLEAQLAFWRAELRGAPPVLELPVDRPRPRTAGGRRGMHPLVLPGALAGELRVLARREGATLFTTVLAGFQALLARWSGQDDVLVGTPVAGRRWAELEGMIGFFVNTLVLRADLAEDPEARGLVAQLRERMLEAQTHQDVPFERLVDDLGVDRSPAHTPLFQAVFSFAGAGEIVPPRLHGLAVEELPAAGGETPFDLRVVLVEEDDRLAGNVEYNAALFDAATAARMAEHLPALLRGMAAHPERRVSALEVLGPAERAQLLDEWSAAAAEVPELPVHERIAAQAARTPDAPAVLFRGERVTFAELAARAERLAGALRAHGVGPDARVGLLLERSPELVAAVLGILGAGGAYVPLDPSLPDERLLFVLRDAGATAVVTDGELAGRIAGFGGAVVLAPSPPGPLAPASGGKGENDDLKEAGALSHSRTFALSHSPSPDNLAYVVYTSGSTGTPKGVLVTHRGLSNYLAWFDREVLGAEGFALPLVSRLGFDAHVRQLFPPLLRGEPVWVLPEEAAADPLALLDALGGRERVSFGGVPSLWGAVLDAVEAGERPAPSGLRAVLLGGEALPADLARRTLARFPGVALWNHYGPTETTVNATAGRVADADRVGIGGPVANARVHLLDAHGSLVPPGVPGELYVGGAGVARGYLGRPDLTAARFLPDPFAGEPGARMYRTGDRARRRASGELEYLGRTDRQAKLRGFRIEPGEVEAALRGHPAVRAAAVTVLREAGREALVAYLTADGPAPPAAELRAWLARSLPEYMVPAAFVVLDAIPTTPSGKLDAAALPAPEPADDQGEPRTPAEEVVAGIFAGVLGLERVGTGDNFFELGGHSLLATRVVARVGAALGVELPLRALFEAQTVAELAARADAERRAGEGAALPPLVPVPRGGPLPLSFAQQRLWFLHRMEPEGTAYVMAQPARLTGRLDARVLRRALGALVERHESLRTTIHPAAEGAVQVVHPAPPARLPVVELGGLAPGDRESEARRLAQEDAGRPFDLERGPLLRAALARLSDDGHVLLLAVHHMVSDGWSMGVLFRDLYALYDALGGGAPPPPPLPVQYADFAAWQRGWLHGDALRRQLDWWRGRLDGAPPVLELPADRPRPPLPSGRGASREFRVSADTTRALRALARREGATLFMVARAAADVLLARWSGQEDLVVGSLIANRTRAELDGIVGFFVNTLALRTDLSGDPPFTGLLGRVREMALGAYAHQDLPFERLVEEIAPERSLSHTPLFQVMFALQNARGGEAPPPAGLRMERLPLETRATLFDLELELQEDGEELWGGVRFRTDLFDPATVERLAAHYGVLLAAVCAAPGERLSGLPVLPAAEQARLLAFGGGPAPRAPGGVPVHRRFAAQAARAPGAPAVLFEGGSLSYAELDARADALARRLRARGVGRGTTVGVCVERGPGVPAAMLAVWKAGGVYLPLDPAYPAGRLALLLRDSGAEVVVTEEAVAGSLPEFGGELVLCDRSPLPLAPSPARGEGETDDAGGQGPLSHSRTFALSHSQSLAYLIYTSGSTGTPKAVMVEHGQLEHALLGLLDVLGLAPGDVVAALASPSFDISLLELAAPLLAGATVRIVSREAVRDPEALVDAAADVTVLHAVPALMRQVVEAVRAGRELPALRLLLVGGDSVPPDLLREMRGVLSAAGARVLYGPTEATIVCASYAVPAAGEVAGHPLGRPLPGVRLRVCGPRGETCPVGVPGELWISGAGVTRGYLGRPELTAEKFVPSDGERAYRTGDRARWRADGVLEFLGRTDAQVKVRGFRIEPGEVEAVLAAHPGVREALAVVREDVPGDRRLVAYVVPAAGGAPPAGLGEHLRARLPEHMVPSAVVALDAFPLGRNGKVDPAALPAPEPAAARGWAAPRTPTEEVVAAVWAEVLRLDRVGADDDFFELGGHSLLATQVVSRVRSALGCELPLRAVFEASTVAALSRRVDRLRSEAPAGAQAPPLVPVPRDGSPLPASFAQQRLWIIDRMEPGSTAYNMPLALRLRGPLDALALGRALAEVVRRHEVLRTTFGDAGGEPFQVVRPAGPPLRAADLSRLPPGERDREADRLAPRLAGRPFDLAAGPLFRPALLRLDDAEHVLVLDMHHVVSDGWSTGVLLGEVAALYEAFSRGASSPLPPLPVQYADYAAWQRAWLRGGVLEAQLAWWRERLAGAPPLLELPVDRPRPPHPGGRAARAERVLPPAAAGRVRALARRGGATPFMALLAVLDLLLARWSAEDDVVVGTPVAGRTRRETEGLIGFFVNTLVLRADVSGNPSFDGLLARVREGTLGAYQHQDVPFERLVEALGVERSPGRTPLFQVMFSVDDGAGAPRGFGGVEAEYRPTGTPAAKFDLVVSVAESAAGLAVRFAYREELWEAATVERAAEAFATLLEGAAADPSRPVLELPLLGGPERERVLREWSGWGAARPAAFVAVHERVAARAAEAPDAVAVECGAARLTRGELDARSLELAGRLRARGVGPESRVAVLAGRSPEGIVAMLAVLRAGGAYLPLDPATPPARVARILEDAGVRLVLAGAAPAERLEGFEGEVVVLDGTPLPPAPSPARGEGEHDTGEGSGAVSRSPSPDSAAYVVYTSGSTGTPKGVVVTHGGLASLVDWHLGAFGVTAADRATQLAGLGFDAAVWETWPYLAAGAALLLVDDEEARTSPAALGRLLLERRATLAFVPTPLAAGLLALEWPARTELRTLLTGGDALRVRPRAGLPFRLVNAYGPTENTVVATAGVVAPESGEARSPAIGRPVAGVWAYVLGSALDPVPAGFPGELWLGGAGVARGYLGRPEMTAEKFVPDPFAGEPGARMYRTGDRARWLPDGALEFLGRADRQVKVRGFRIEPGEIEAVLARHPAVRGVAVVVREDAPGNPRIAAYLEADGGVPAAELRELARASLPEYMVPSAFVLLGALPLTPTGKLDRRALPAPEATAEEGDVEPRTRLERTLAEVWADVLGLPRVGTGASFFDLGGNSLLVVQLVARLEAELGRRVRALDVFEHPSVAALARHLAGGEDPEAESPAGPDRSGKLAAGKGRLDRLRKRRDAGGE